MLEIGDSAARRAGSQRGGNSSPGADADFLPFPELPVVVVCPLHAVVASPGADACFVCQLSHAHAHVQWSRDGVALTPGHKYSMTSWHCTRTLTVHDVTADDEGRYALVVPPDEHLIGVASPSELCAAELTLEGR